MNRRILILLAVVLSYAPLHAQIRFGVKGGVNVTDMTFRSDVFQASSNKGFFLGPSLKLSLPILGLGIDASLLYSFVFAGLQLGLPSISKL